MRVDGLGHFTTNRALTVQGFVVYAGGVGPKTDQPWRAPVLPPMSNSGTLDIRKTSLKKIKTNKKV
jgi:hypothetical protein